MSGSQRFKDSATINFEHEYPHLNLHVATDGNAPDINDIIIDDELTVKESGTIKAALFDDNGNKRSQVYTYTVERLTAIEPEEVTSMNLVYGLNFIYTEGEHDLIPDFENERIIKKRNKLRIRTRKNC